MAASKLFLLTTVMLALLCSATSRPLPETADLAARLQSDSMMPCWNSLLELRSCTGEVILFFLNGETYLGPSCCQAIYTIEHQCWPSMLFSVGFTPEEADILRGYCDASEASTLAPPPPPPPGPARSPIPAPALVILP
ncbi:egg cell-secreted protein 1.2-like [Aristolochia californica]|uniref:egg cell-secreted protein 1.2-like n=1 Tax=Aristolochia californica TaxID=171875 RepID=UPI0035E09FC5